MNWIIACARFIKAASTLIVIVCTFGEANATVLYNQDFESANPGQVANPSGVGFTSATLNIGGPALHWEYTATGGVGGSKGLNISFDGTNRSLYAIGFGAAQPTASAANPLDNGSVSDPSQIRFSVDVLTVGSLNSTPVRQRVYQVDNTYEADRHIDANLDGDMTDGAIIFQSDYWPTLATGYNHVGYTLDQGQISAFVNAPGLTPITPEFDPTITLQWGIYFDNIGFGSDAGNLVSVDNIQIESVPEPSTIAMLIGAMYYAAFFKKRPISFSRELAGTALC